MNLLQQKDLQYIWHPCSQMKDYEDLPPIVIEKGKGVFLYDQDGKSYLDAVSSWWVNLFGHSNQRINQVIQAQVERLEHVIFANFSHQPAIELAERLVQITPDRLNKVFFADNGSSAVEVALKLTFQYFQQIGKPKKTKFAALTDAYHGETLGALSVGDLGLYKEVFQPILLNTVQIQGPDCYRCQYGLNRDTCQAECFDTMQSTVEKNHEELAAIIIEPMIQGASGMKIYSPIYLQKLRKLCDQYDIFLIADEIAMGFGRTGKMFACEHAGISPDLMTLSKGITAGYMPLSVVLLPDQIYDAFYGDYTKVNSFLHSHSYTGNPIGCAIACETLNIFEDEQILEKNKMKSLLIREKVEQELLHLPYVGEFRQLGMVGAVELVKNQKKKTPFNWQQRVGYEIYKIALQYGVLLRPLGNILYFMPPYVINEKEIDLMVGTARKAIEDYFHKN